MAVKFRNLQQGLKRSDFLLGLVMCLMLMCYRCYFVTTANDLFNDATMGTMTKSSSLAAGAPTDDHDLPPTFNHKTLPEFSRYPSTDSMCHTISSLVKHYCARTHLPPAKCQMHNVDPFSPPAQVQVIVNNAAAGPTSTTTSGTHNRSACKTLWFSGIHEHESCEYKKLYAAALNSAMHNARDVLQPVILLGQKGTPFENSTDHSKFGNWAKGKGAIVINVPFLSFQQHVDKKYKDNLNIQGAFLRLEIPRMIKEHNILKMPNICPHYVLYTDVDVLFPNKLFHEDMQILKDTLSTSDSSAYVMYGREFSKDPHIINTGVMMLHVEKFAHVLPKILQLADKKDYDTADQGMINNYFTQNQTTRRERILLPIHYNWKSYWKLEPSSFYDIKIYHHHGPKPGKCLEIMADCNVNLIGTLSQQYKPYAEHIRQGICCDAGRTARWALDAFHALAADTSHVC